MAETEPTGRAALHRFWTRVRASWVARGIAGLFLLGILGAGALYWWLAHDLPGHEAVVDYQPDLPTTVVGRDGEILTIFARERRIFVPFDAVPPMVVQAFISAEDKTFFSHAGLDFPGIARAMMTNIRQKLTGSGKRPVGASTITQQVAQAILVGRELSYIRKAKEMILARRIEKAISKERILELYLNQIFLGRNSYGVGAAAQSYYGKTLDELTLQEIAYLAALPKGPSYYHPIRRKQEATERRNYVLGQMAENEYITPAQRDAAIASELVVELQSPGTINRIDNFVLEEVRRTLIDRFGEDAVYKGGMWVHITIDSEAQAAAEAAMRDGMLRLDRNKSWRGPLATLSMADGEAAWLKELRALESGQGVEGWRLALVERAASGGSLSLRFADGSAGAMSEADAARTRDGVPASRLLKPGDVVPVERRAAGGDRYALRQVPAVSGGFIAQDPRSGQIRAMVGGFDGNRSAFNRATQAFRQPGSSFKPFVYAVALDNGLTPASLVVDGEFCVYQGRLLGRKCFRNFDRRTSGAKTLRDGLEKSRNLMTVRLAHKVGMVKVSDFARRMGIVDEMSPVLAMALGAGETTVERLVNAYSILANGGRALTPTLIDRVQDRNGRVIYRSDVRACPTCQRAEWGGQEMPVPDDPRASLVDARTAYQIVHMLEGVITNGTGTRLKFLDRPLAGKTGTTNNSTDVWFVGMTPELVAGLYLGHDQPTPMGSWVQGGTVAAPVYGEFAKRALAGARKVGFTAPPGVRLVRVDRKTGLLVHQSGPGTVWEAFKPGLEPRRGLDDGLTQFVESDAAFVDSAGGIY